MCKQHKSVIDYLTSKQGLFATQLQPATATNGDGTASNDGGSPKKSVHFDSASENEKGKSSSSRNSMKKQHHHRKHKRKHSTESKTRSTNQSTNTDADDEEHEVFVQLKQTIHEASIHDKKLVNGDDDSESGSEPEDAVEVSIESYNGEKYFRTFGALIPTGYVLK
jgi:hypothetical protein